MMNEKLLSVELKSGHTNSGPAWIGIPNYSKSKSTIYFNGMAFKRIKGGGISGNFYEVQSSKEYWISGVKKNREDRHWLGNGPIEIDQSVVDIYLELLGLSVLPKNLKVVTLKLAAPTLELHELENKSLYK